MPLLELLYRVPKPAFLVRCFLLTRMLHTVLIAQLLLQILNLLLQIFNLVLEGRTYVLRHVLPIERLRERSLCLPHLHLQPLGATFLALGHLESVPQVVIVWVFRTGARNLPLRDSRWLTP